MKPCERSTFVRYTKGLPFLSKWYTEGRGIGPRGGASPYTLYNTLVAHSFPRATLSEICSLLGTDECPWTNIRAYFRAKWRLFFIYSTPGRVGDFDCSVGSVRNGICTCELQQSKRRKIGRRQNSTFTELGSYQRQRKLQKIFLHGLTSGLSSSLQRKTKTLSQ